jgi:hypothetical protein
MNGHEGLDEDVGKEEERGFRNFAHEIGGENVLTVNKRVPPGPPGFL